MRPSYRVGTTSYILADNILPNARYLADKVEDIELVLFEVDDGQNNLPTAEDIEALADLAAETGLTYTVHLPLDLKLGGQNDQLHNSLKKARRVIDRTQLLEPFAYVLHLDGEAVKDYPRWVVDAARSLELTAEWVDDPALLSVENLENYPLDFLDPVLSRAPASRCLDIGHLWLEGHDPIPFIKKHLARTRVVHLHGIGSRDHQSLALIERSKLESVLEALDGFNGVVTLEVFNQADLESSIQALRKAGMEWHLL